MSTKSTQGIAPSIEKLLETLRSELESFFRRDSHHVRNGRQAHIYFEPLMRGQKSYENRELMTINAKLNPMSRDSNDLVVHIGLSNPVGYSGNRHIQVESVAKAFAEFVDCRSVMLMMAGVNPAPSQPLLNIPEWQPLNLDGVNPAPSQPLLSVTVILSNSMGPLAILLGDSNSGKLSEDRQALMQARLLNAISRQSISY